MSNVLPHAALRRAAPLALLVGAAAIALYFPVSGFDFLKFDDQVYVTDNPRVRQGLGVRGVIWALTTFHASNWHPLTWLSHMLDVTLFGMRPAGHHLVNAVLHGSNAALLLLLLAALTGSVWRSLLVAALFAFHPLNVETVAWVAERKNVLSTFFWLLAVASYLGYVRRPAPRRAALVLLSAALGLMAKPMLVTLPFTLLLLDWWPLGRLASGSASTAGAPAPARSFRRLVFEKWPLFLLAAAAAILTLIAQSRGGAVSSLTNFPLGGRLANAVTAGAGYLAKMVWPVGLAVFYPHLGGRLPLLHSAATALVLTVITVAAFRLRHRSPALHWGWLWYLGTLVPVSGLIQVGKQGIADRYAYVTLIGLFVAAAWLLPGGRAAPRLRAVIVGGSSVVLAGLIVLTARQIPVWRDDITLFTQALRINPRFNGAYFQLGYALRIRGRLDEALTQYRTALAICPDCWDARCYLADNLLKMGETGEALVHYREAARLAPERSDVRNNLGVALVLTGHPEEAEASFIESIRLDEGNHEAHANLSKSLLARGETAAALAHQREAERIRR